MTTHDTFIAQYVAAFDAADRPTLERLYEPGALLVPVPGTPVSGAARAAATEHLLGLGGPMRASIRHAYEVDDIALLVVDWSVHGTARTAQTSPWQAPPPRSPSAVWTDAGAMLSTTRSVRLEPAARVMIAGSGTTATDLSLWSHSWRS